MSAEHNSDQTGVGKRSAPVSLWRMALLQRCPKCQRASLYNGVLELKGACTGCGVDLGSADVGDGPQVFVILILGALIAVLAAILQVTFAPEPWVHLIIWPPFIIGAALWLIRALKAVFVALQFETDAGEGRLDTSHGTSDD